MNKQYKSPEKRGIEWTDYTWNPIGGCHHRCRWKMPDGSTAICYAEEVANKLRSDTFYAHGFEHHYYHPDRLIEPFMLKKPSKIFLDSMSDLMGHWVPDEHILAVLNAAATAHWHTFQLLTKNAPRLLKFDFPDNVWVGVSAPPSSYMGKPLALEQQHRYMHKALDVLRDVKARVRWLSIEPLSFDMNSVIYQWSIEHMVRLPLEWAVIGAATNGPRVYQPDPEWVRLLISGFEYEGTPVFFKGNLKGNLAAAPWREEFPT